MQNLVAVHTAMSVTLHMERCHAGGLRTRLGSHRRPDAALSPQGGGLKGEEGSLPKSGGTGSDSGRPSQSPVLSEGGGEEPAVQGVEHTEVG